MSKKWIIIWLALVFALFLFVAIVCFYKDKPLLLIISEFTIPILFAITIWIINQLMIPYKTMSRSINMLKEEDFNSTLVRTGNDDVDSLVIIYNSMINKLREEKLSVREKNQFLDLLIESSPLGIIVLDLDDRIITANTTAYRFLGLDPPGLITKSLSDIDSTLTRSMRQMDYLKKESVILPDGKNYICQRLFFMDHGFKHPFYIIEEMTEEIRKAEREAYGKLIRMMAHEVNNTIGSVNSIMSSVVSEPDIFKEKGREEIISLISVAIQRNQKMNRFMKNFSNVVRLPKPEKGRMDINDSLKIVIESFYPVIKSKQITLKINADPSNPVINADQSQMEQVFTNILKNSIEAVDEKGTIKITSSTRPVRVIFEDNGPGLDENVIGKLFTPFFSTKPEGQGIGLTLIQEILSNHGFWFTFTNGESGGTVFTMRLENNVSEL
jgi:two-component system, NtrC family, nitrogen regulation sensor histidine kinase NtrY